MRFSAKDDQQAFERMLDGLVATGRLEFETANGLKRRAADLVAETERPASAVTPTLAAAPVPVPNFTSRPVLQPQPLVPLRIDTDMAAELTVADDERRSRLKSLAAAEKTDAPRNPLLEERQTTASIAPAPPRKVWSEMAASFLADHNIRWGELVAGMLIVVCSIGLVISLWNTLTAAHRIVPTLIFISADAAIFAAGLYTMRRWRLRHTSRAVLIVATLLVPLCVLAGLAAANANGNGTPATGIDPVTIVAMLLGVGGVGWLLHQSSRCLVGRVDAWSMTLGVAVPTLCLPLVRWFPDWIGLSVATASAVIAVAVLIPRGRSELIHQRGRLGHRMMKNRWLTAGVALAALIAMVGYAAITLAISPIDAPENASLLNHQLWFTLAIAMVPSIVAIGRGASIDRRSTIGTGSVINSVISLIAFGSIAAILPAAVQQPNWVWWLGTTVSISMLLVAGTLWRRKSERLSTSSIAWVPVAIAACLTATDWAGDLDWETLPSWRLILAGETMLVCMAVASLAFAMAFGLCRRFRGKDSGESIGRTTSYAAIGFAAAGVSIAIVLAFAPPTWRGIAPEIAVVATLLLGILGIWWRSLSDVRWTEVAVAVSLAVAWSILSPIDWSTNDFLLNISRLPLILLMAGGASVAMGWAADRVGSFATASRYSRSGFGLAVATTVVGLACLKIRLDEFNLPVALDAEQVSKLCALAAIVMAGAASVGKLRLWLRTAMAVSGLSVLIALTNRWGQSVWAWEHIGNGSAIWRAAMVIAIASLIWLAIREWFGTVAAEKVLRRRDLRWWRSEKLSRSKMPDGWGVLAATGLTSLAVLHQHIGLLFSPIVEFGGLERLADWIPTNQWTGLSGVSLLITAIAIGWSGWRERSIWFSGALGIFVASSIVHATHYCAAWTSRSSSIQLIAATWMMIVISAGILFVFFRYKRASDRIVHACGYGTAIAVLLASVSLLVANEQSTRSLSIAFHVSAWLSIASVAGLFWQSRLQRNDEAQQRSPLLAILSASLLPTAGIVVSEVVWPNQWLVWCSLSVACSFIWLVLARWRDQDKTLVTGIVLSQGWIGLVGIASVLVSFAPLRTGELIANGENWIAATIIASAAVLAIMGWIAKTRINGSRHDLISRSFDHDTATRVSVGVSLLAGHVATLPALWRIDWTPSSYGMIVLGTWCVAAAVSSVLDWRRPAMISRFQVTVIALLTWLLVAFGGLRLPDWSPWLSIAGLIMVGWIWNKRLTVDAGWETVSRRIVGWSVLLLGLISIALLRDIGPVPTLNGQTWAIASLAWVVSWCLIWRARPHGLADAEASLLAMPLVAMNLMVWMEMPEAVRNTPVPMVLHLSSIGMACLVALSAVLRPAQRAIWKISLLHAMLAFSSLAMSACVLMELDGSSLVVVGFVAATLAIGLCTAIRNGLIRITARLNEGQQPPVQPIAFSKLNASISTWSVLLALGGTLVAASLIASGTGLDLLRWLALAVMGLAVTLFVVAERSRESRDRLRCVGVALWSLGMLAILGQPPVAAFWLLAVMRLFIGSVLATATIVLVLPRWLPQTLAERWSDAFRVGGLIAGFASIGFLLAMLVLEAMLRQPNVGLPEVPLPIVVVVSGMLAMLAIVAATVAVITRVPKDIPNVLSMSDTKRRICLWSAQAIGVCAWLHLYLCRPNLAFSGLRDAWPFVVMGIAFLSVALTQWASRRGDQVIADSMRRTSLFLPLVPLVGFWISGSTAGWSFDGGVSYQSVLLVAAISYGVMSWLYKQGLPRVATVILGNAALWLTLTELPGWDFLSHPQAWLIPPAVCVLVVAQLQRRKLDAKQLASIRYGATLMIYIASTADMLIADIGSSLMGPIVLISLALLGMFVGVMLRVKPFLLLGAIFVFLGLISMVWHAGRAIDAVWPWWVFGISMGLTLLVGLAMLEKYRPELNRWTQKLAAWEG